MQEDVLRNVIQRDLSTSFTDAVKEKLRDVCRSVCAEAPIGKLITLAFLLGRCIGSVYEEFKESPYTSTEAGIDIVRGSGNQPAPLDVFYLTKLDAMRDPRPIFDAIRLSFFSTAGIVPTTGLQV